LFKKNLSPLLLVFVHPFKTIFKVGIDFLQETGGWEWLQYVAAATILFGSFIAMTNDNLKARLAYSTISQLSYIVLAAMLAKRSLINLGLSDFI